MIKRPQFGEVVLGIDEGEVLGLIDKHDFIITPDGKAMSMLYIGLLAEGGVILQKEVASLITRETIVDGYMVLNLNCSVEVVHQTLVSVQILQPEVE